MRVRCKRIDGRGDHPAPEPIVDALCCAVHVGRERGRVYLDGQGTDKEVVQVGGPFRGVPDRGSVVEVHDAQSGEPYRAALRGVEISAAVESSGAVVVDVTYDLERSL